MMSGEGQFEILSITRAVQAGSVLDARRIVERYQHDVLGCAYVLTGRQPEATTLSGRLFEQALARLDEFDPDEEFFPWLLRHIPAALQSTDLADTPAVGGFAPDRFRVDDDRSRLLHGLEMLTLEERLRIVLVDYSGLTESDAAEIVQQLSTGGGAGRHLAEVRARLRNLAAIDDRQTISSALRRLAVEAPRAALWPTIEERIVDLVRRQRMRRRLMRAGVVVGMLVLLGVPGWFLAYGALEATEPGGSGVAGGQVGASFSVTPTATLSPTATATPYIPEGDVPDRLIAELSPGDDNRDARTQVEPPAAISPDGRTLLSVREEAVPGSDNLTLIATSNATGGERWSAEIALPGHDYDDLVVVDDQVYLASHARGGRSSAVTVTKVRLADGSLQDSWNFSTDAEGESSDLHVDLYRAGTADAPVLILHLYDATAGWQQVRQISSRDGGTIFQSDPVAGPIDPDGARTLAPDGRGLISIPAHGLVEDPSIGFLIFDTMTEGRIALPFGDVAGLGGVVVAFAYSHDGQRLYALDIYQQRIAIVDLERRQVERVVDLQGGDSARKRRPALGSPPVSGQFSDAPMAFSLDGSYLYAMSPPDDTLPSPSPGIWKIDTRNWTIEAEWLLGAQLPVASIHMSDADTQLYVHYREQPSSDPGEIIGETRLISTVDGQPVDAHAIPTGPIFGTLADFYRMQFGKSPALDGRVPQDNHLLPDLPLLDVQLDPASGPSGTTVALRVTVLDPTTGSQLPGMVEDSPVGPAPEAIIAIFSNRDQRRTLFMSLTGAAIYQGSVLLDLPGLWDLEVTTGAPGDDSVRFFRSAAVEIVDTVPGPDGRDYRLQLVSFPDAPAAGRLTDLAVTLVAAHDDGPELVPDDFSANLPPAVDVTLPDGTTVVFYRSGNSTYSGFVRFTAPGIQFLTVTFPSFTVAPVRVILSVIVEN